MKKVFVFVLFVSGFASAAEIPPTNTVFHNESREQTSLVCKNADHGGQEFVATTTGSTFIPSYFSLKTSVFFIEIPNSPFDDCTKYTYTSNVLRPEHVVFPNYQVYKNIEAQYLGQLDANTIQKAEISELERDYLELKALKVSKDDELSNIIADRELTEDQNDELTARKTALNYRSETLQSKTQNNASVLYDYEDKKRRISSLILTLEAKKEELRDAQSKYVITQPGGVIREMIPDYDVTAGPEYNFVEYLENYIQAHQSDIRTNKESDLTRIDLDYMKLKFLETKEVR